MQDTTVRYINSELREKARFIICLDTQNQTARFIKADIYNEMADLFETALNKEEEATSCLGDG